MTDRDRLIELLDDFDRTYDCFRVRCEQIAKYLIANGVFLLPEDLRDTEDFSISAFIEAMQMYKEKDRYIKLPCKVGDKVYYVHETLWDNDYKNKVISESVKKRILKIVERPNHFTNLALEVLHFDYCFITDWIKGNIFLTKEEAEEKLKERAG